MNRSLFTYVSGLVVAAISFASVVHAGGAVTVPEIDGVTISSGLGLLAAGVLVIRSRRRR